MIDDFNSAVPDTRLTALALVSLDRLRRDTALKVHVLVPKNWEHGTLSSGLQILREITG